MDVPRFPIIPRHCDESCAADHADGRADALVDGAEHSGFWNVQQMTKFVGGHFAFTKNAIQFPMDCPDRDAKAFVRSLPPDENDNAPLIGNQDNGNHFLWECIDLPCVRPSVAEKGIGVLDGESEGECGIRTARRDGIPLHLAVLLVVGGDFEPDGILQIQDGEHRRPVVCCEKREVVVVSKQGGLA